MIIPPHDYIFYDVERSRDGGWEKNFNTIQTKR